MEPETPSAPPVVAVVVVHEPGDWFDETLEAFARQDYPNLRMLFLVVADNAPTAGAVTEPTTEPTGVEAIEERIQQRLPGSFVRAVGANVGFGSTANEVLRLVEGANGFFLICHDDVAPEPGALRLMVEELYRSNAGAVGPKFVEWDDPSVLQAVGLGMDRFGEIDPVIEPDEVDQEQHDGVRDVFVLPSAYLLVRADLFRELGGFDPAIDFYGEDTELCWRIHHSGARVVVVPSARVRHIGRLRERRPDLRHGLLRARHRMRSVATLTGASRLPARSIEMVLLTLTELVVGLFTARFGQAWNSFRALIGLIPRTPRLLARRRDVKAIRRVPEREVYSLQESGSARLNSYLRSRETATYVGQGVRVRRWRQSTTAPVVAWIAVIIGLIVGGRSFFDGGLPPVGEFLPFPESPRQLLDTFLSGWNPNGAGATSPNATGWATLAGLSVFTLFNMGLLQTLFVLGLLLVGVAGLWRLAAVFPSTRARIAALLVYALSPLVSGAMSGGRLTVLVAYAATPWVLHLVRRAAGVETADPHSADFDVTDGIIDLAPGERLRRVVVAAIVLAVAVAFAPVMLPLTVALTVVFAVGTLLAQGSLMTAGWSLVAGFGAAAGAAVLNLPWITAWTWEGLVGAPPIGEAGLGLLPLASFEIGRTDFAALALALYLPVLAAVLLARAWRLTWAIRSALMVLVFGALAVLGDRGAMPIDLPEAGVLLVPVALGLSISAAAALAAFDLDVRGGTFGWRQPLGILSSVAVVVGLAPGLGALADGSFQVPTTPLARLLDASLPEASSAGDYNVLLVGDARLLPVPGTAYRDGIAWAIVDDGALDVRDRWMPPSNAASELVTSALDEMASTSTLRAGRLLAPLSIRFVVVPEFDGVASTVNEPLPLPTGLIAAFEDQLDLVAVRPGLPTLEAFENRAWIPTYSQLDDAGIASSGAAGAEVLVRTDLSASSPVFVGADQLGTATDDVTSGVVHLAVPFDDSWSLSVNDNPAEPRRAFGETTAFDVPASGAGELRYETSAMRWLAVAAQIALWLAAFVIAARVRVSVGRRGTLLLEDETLIDLTDDPASSLDDPNDDHHHDDHHQDDHHQDDHHQDEVRS
ncbi:MAG TPA: glycosyltransferase family 2 protein [Ilumatobacteraceae bacterium]|nr:glycosyltransferase family 2 protein [Ilumatobacteraceae bacterium]